jgi:hypothetical protein
MDTQTFPTIPVDGVPRPLKFRIGDLLALERDHGLNMLDSAAMSASLVGIEQLRRTTLLAWAGLRHTFTTPVTPEQLADQLDLSDLAAVARAVNEALVKASPLRQATPAGETIPGNLLPN